MHKRVATRKMSTEMSDIVLSNKSLQALWREDADFKEVVATPLGEKSNVAKSVGRE